MAHPSPEPISHSSLGLPERLVKHAVQYPDYHLVNWDDLTPMLRHYVEVKEQHPQSLLLYRVGDFFETFFQDAIAVARELEVVLTTKDGGKEVGKVPLAGVPHHALGRYCALLVEKGFSVAVCDQVEDPSAAQGNLIRRAVTRVITPGTVLEDGMLTARRNNFLAAVVMAGEHWGLAYADVSTGEFFTTQTHGLTDLNQEIMRIQPSEILLPTNSPHFIGLLRPGESRDHLPDGLPNQFCYTLRPQLPFTQSEARQRLLLRFQVRSLEGMGCETLPLAVRAAGGLLEYLEATFKQPVTPNPTSSPPLNLSLCSQSSVPLQPLRTYTLSDFLILDHQTRRNLEIIQTIRDGTFHGSLLWALDHTVTAMGGRMLRRWLLQPLLEPSAIQNRQDTIEELVTHHNLRQELQSLLKQIYDLERLAGRAGSGTANARDLVALADSLGKLPVLSLLVTHTHSSYLQTLQTIPPQLEQLEHYLRDHLVDTPPLCLTEGNLIRDGVDPKLDSLRQQLETDHQWIADLEKTERERTGITNLKVGFNKAFGYYITISRSRKEQIPANYHRKQTLTNEERFITTELKDRESRIFSAQEMVKKLEYEWFIRLRDRTGTQAQLIRQMAAAVAAVDVLTALADVAIQWGYCRPVITLDRRILIEAGRHPVVEQSLPAGFFVANSTHMGLEGTAGVSSTINHGTVPCPDDYHASQGCGSYPDLIILTGPNASGKSCYLRQVGLIQLMAQVGSFVPAKAAQVGICDRIFTRVGAVDDLATGQSTFMVEMNETANILNHATGRSLVLLDEIGRGTATFDGLAIAWSVAEYLATDIGSRTIFATHYHELNELASFIRNVANYQVVVKELADEIVFLHQVHPGGAHRSYGIEAGRLAGLPHCVIQRAKQVMTLIEKHSKITTGLRKFNSRLENQGSQHYYWSEPKQSPWTDGLTPEPVCSEQQLTIFSVSGY